LLFFWPGHIVLTFQLANRGDVNFLLLLLLLCAWFLFCASGFALILKHPMKQADSDGSAPYLMGAAQLEAGGSYHVAVA